MGYQGRMNYLTFREKKKIWKINKTSGSEVSLFVLYKKKVGTAENHSLGKWAFKGRGGKRGEINIWEVTKRIGGGGREGERERERGQNNTKD